jgi:hypothetical protein
MGRNQSLPPRRRYPSFFAIGAGVVLTCTVAFAAAKVRVTPPTSVPQSAQAKAAELETRAIVDDNLHMHLKRLHGLR